MDISDSFDAVYEASIQETIEMIDEKTVVIEEGTQVDQGFFDSLVHKIETGISDLSEKGSELLNRGKNIISNFIDAVAVLIITTCVIPLAAIMAAIWLAKLLFDLRISLPKENPVKLQKILKR